MSTDVKQMSFAMPGQNSTVCLQQLYCIMSIYPFIHKYELSTEIDLMTHKQKVRTEKVSICWQFATGSCDFGEEYCLFSHCQSRQNRETVMFKCNSCDREFQFRSDFLKHRKQEHTHLVPLFSENSLFLQSS